MWPSIPCTKNSHKKTNSGTERASVTIEYVLVCLFSIVVTTGALAFLKGALDQKIQPIANSLGIDYQSIELPFLEW